MILNAPSCFIFAIHHKQVPSQHLPMKTAELITEKGTMHIEFYEKDAPEPFKILLTWLKKDFTMD